MPHGAHTLFPAIPSIANSASNSHNPEAPMLSQAIIPPSDSTSNSHNMEAVRGSQIIASPSESPPSPPTHHQSQIIVSTSGNIFPITMFPLSQTLHPDVQVKQMNGILKLEMLFPAEWLKQHNFKWNVKLDEWLPFYEFWKPSPSVLPTIDQIWEEHMEGIGSPRSFSILELTANWGGRWKWNIQKIKTESSK